MTRFDIAKGSLYGAAATAALVLASPGVAYAQTAPAAQTIGVEDIVVTARKREENLQSVPIAVTAIGGEELRQAQITDLSQIAAQVPSFTFQSQNSMESEMFIRGVGSVRLNGATADPSIGTFLDEVYIGRRGSATPPIFDLQRVEVLRGPQGTLFGKNIVGGAINMITAAPEFEFNGGGSVALGNYSSVLSEGYITGALGETVAGRLALYQESHDGYAHNIVTGDELEDKHAYAGRASLLWNIGNDVSLTVIADASSETGGGPSRHSVDNPFSPGFGFVAPNINPDPRTNESPYEQYARRTTAGLTARLEWDLGPVDLTYLAAYRYGDADGRWTQAGAGAPPSITSSTLTQHELYRGITQEVRLASDQDQRFRWLGGLYYLNESTERSSQNTATSFLPGGPGSTRDILDGDNIYIQDGDTISLAAYGEVEFDLLSNLTLSVGGRYTRDDKDYTNDAVVLSLGPPGDLFSTAPLTGPYSIDVSKDWSEFTPRIGLEWNVTDDILIYASYAGGFKGGGWQGGAANAVAAETPYDPETASSYELGIKSDWFDRRLRINLAAFHTDFQDLQVELLDDVNLTLVIANAADAVIEGLEAEVQFRADEHLTLFASGSVLDAKYENYIDPLRGIDYSGNQIQRTPDYQFNIGGDFRHDITESLELTAHLDYSYQDEMFWGPDNTNLESGYGLANGRVGIGPQDGAWAISLFGRNLTDELYRVSIIPFSGDEFSVYGAPRTYGVRLAGRF